MEAPEHLPLEVGVVHRDHHPSVESLFFRRGPVLRLSVCSLCPFHPCRLFHLCGLFLPYRAYRHRAYNHGAL